MVVIRIVAAFAMLSLASCGSEEVDVAVGEVSQPVRIETTAATFLVRESMAADFQRLLAGEPTQNEFYAGLE